MLQCFLCGMDVHLHGGRRAAQRVTGLVWKGGQREGEGEDDGVRAVGPALDSSTRHQHSGSSSHAECLSSALKASSSP